MQTENIDKLVYVRPVAVADLPSDVQEQVEGVETLYAVHRSDGEQLALVTDRQIAFQLALDNDLAPVMVH